MAHCPPTDSDVPLHKRRRTETARKEAGKRCMNDGHKQVIERLQAERNALYAMYLIANGDCSLKWQVNDELIAKAEIIITPGAIARAAEKASKFIEEADPSIDLEWDDKTPEPVVREIQHMVQAAYEAKTMEEDNEDDDEEDQASVA